MPANPEVRSIQDIPGWFPQIDEVMFEFFISPRTAIIPDGDLVELGVYLGRSAAFMGRFRQAGQLMTVCDLFGAAPDDGPNARENNKSYSTLDRQKFESNYLALHDELPVIVQGPSSEIMSHVKPESVRFLHVDASHLYEHVRTDVDSAIAMLRPDAVVAFDDYRSDHTPGVSAAVWEAVFTRGLRPIVMTQQKLYGTFGDAAVHRERLMVWLGSSAIYPWESQLIAGEPVLRVRAPKDRAAPGTPKVDVAALQKRAEALQKNAEALQKRVAALETSTRSDHDRLDTVDGRLRAFGRELRRLEQYQRPLVDRVVRKVRHDLAARTPVKH